MAAQVPEAWRPGTIPAIEAQQPDDARPCRSASFPGGWAEPAALDSAIARAQAGDEAAFRVLYRDTQPRVLRYLQAFVGPDAEDVASETWLQVARDLPGFRGDGDGFRGWVATVARHRATDHLRRAGRRPQPATVTVADLETWAASDDTAGQALELMATEAAIGLISQLPRDQAGHGPRHGVHRTGPWQTPGCRPNGVLPGIAQAFRMAGTGCGEWRGESGVTRRRAAALKGAR
jgi:RNA polymerase sigma factor (sigma-70 family)